MLSWKKIWTALLLVIASTGQLPLWLHDSLCHHQHGTSGCAEHHHGSTHGLTDCRESANSDALAQSTTDCPWGHVDGASPNNSKRIPRLGSQTGTDAHNCAACYFLSQLITPSPIQTFESPSLLVTAIRPGASAWIDLDLLAVYASRAPPAV